MTNYEKKLLFIIVFIIIILLLLLYIFSGEAMTFKERKELKNKSKDELIELIIDYDKITENQSEKIIDLENDIIIKNLKIAKLKGKTSVLSLPFVIGIVTIILIIFLAGVILFFKFKR